jgi:hypothetical protein
VVSFTQGYRVVLVGLQSISGHDGRNTLPLNVVVITPTSYSGGRGFKSQPGDWLS